MDGVHDARNQLLHDVAGVKHMGKLASRDQATSLSEGGLYAAQSLPTLGQPTRFELAGGKSEGEITTQFPMTQLEGLGLLKMDFLGLKTLTVIRKAIDLVRQAGDL